MTPPSMLFLLELEKNTKADLEGPSAPLPEVLGAGEAAAALVHRVHPGLTAHRSLGASFRVTLLLIIWKAMMGRC